MALRPREEIGKEMHQDRDQFFRIEEGEGEDIIDGQRTKIADDAAVIVPAGALALRGQDDGVTTGFNRGRGICFAGVNLSALR
jgi:uncharacterized cupin superfamily protein